MAIERVEIDGDPVSTCLVCSAPLKRHEVWTHELQCAAIEEGERVNVVAARPAGWDWLPDARQSAVPPPPAET